MKKTLLSTLVLITLLTADRVCPAQETTAKAGPMATLSFSGYDALMADLDFIGRLGGNPGLAKSLEAVLKMQTQDEGLAGLDKTRPWGVAVMPNPATLADAFAFLPVNDLKKLLSVLESTGMPNKDVGQGVTEVGTPAGLPLFVKQKGDWAILSNTPDGLDDAPADPSTLLDGSEKKYDLAVRLLLNNLPPALKQMALGWWMSGVEEGLERKPGESDEQLATRNKATKQTISRIKTLVEDVDVLLVGLNIDAAARNAYFDLEVTARPGSKTAEDFAQVKCAPSNFTGFDLPEATVTTNWVGKLSEMDVAQSKAAVEMVAAKARKHFENQNLSDTTAAKAGQLLAEVILASMEAGETDGGLAAILDPSDATLLVGVKVADDAKLDKVLRDLAKKATDESPELAKAIKPDAETHQEVTLHTLSIPVPRTDRRDLIVRMVGEELDVVVGTGPNSVYLAAGRNAAARLKAAIDKSKAETGKEVPPTRLSVAVTPLVQFVATVADDPDVRQRAGMIAMVLQQAGTDNHVTITTKPIPNGISQRLTIESGLLKILGAMSQMIVPSM